MCGGEEISAPGSKDWRWKFLERDRNMTQSRDGPDYQWSTADEPEGYLQPVGYGIIAYPLEAALELNGYDEGMDAGTQLVDTSFGCRLARHGWPIQISTGLVCEHEAHETPDQRVVLSYDPKLGTASIFHGATHCNRALWHWQKSEEPTGLTLPGGGIPKRANDRLPTITPHLHCPYFDDASAGCVITKAKCETPNLARPESTDEVTEWQRNVRTFDLRAERQRVQEEMYGG